MRAHSYDAQPMSSRTRSAGVLAGDVVVVSPHLDDAVFSLGAAISRAVRSGASVGVLTVFAGDPDSAAPASWWDRKAGFETEGEAARARRAEDREACSVVGASPTWLRFSDAAYEREPDEEALWSAVLNAVDRASLILLPGFPLRHVDHLYLTRLALVRGLPVDRIGLYVEQPYAK